jgi:hypothetical protein
MLKISTSKDDITNMEFSDENNHQYASMEVKENVKESDAGKRDKSIVYLVSEKIMSVLLHINIMIAFELYFYFDFIVAMERTLFLDKIDEYFSELEYEYDNDLSHDYKMLIKQLIITNPYGSTYFYDQYKESEKEQSKLLEELLHKSLIVWGIYAFVFMLTFINSVSMYDKIKWKSVFIENIAMLVLLGLFEYLFFVNVILQYSPVTDEEIEYVAYSNMLQIVNGTNH